MSCMAVARTTVDPRIPALLGRNTPGFFTDQGRDILDVMHGRSTYDYRPSHPCIAGTKHAGIFHRPGREGGVLMSCMAVVV